MIILVTLPGRAPARAGGGRRSFERASASGRCALGGRAEVERRPVGDDAARVQKVVSRVVVALDLLHGDRGGDAGLLVEVAGVAPEVRVVDQAALVALEMAVVDGIEAHQRGK